jgi:hypothetical protein
MGLSSDERYELQRKAVATFGPYKVAELCDVSADRLDRNHCVIAADGWGKLATAARKLDRHDLADRFEAAGEPNFG